MTLLLGGVITFAMQPADGNRKNAEATKRQRNTSVVGSDAVAAKRQRSTSVAGRRETGRKMPAWKPGMLDIHAISAGRGECYFLIFPDGTSMLVDAGELFTGSKKYRSVAPRPSADVRPVEVYASYIRDVLPEVCRDSIDYALLTHFHADHLGQRDSSGFMALYGHIPYRHIVNRAVPDSASRLGDSTASYERYTAWLDGKPSECFELGSDSQFKMRHGGIRNGTSFGVLNVCVNGCVWKDPDADSDVPATALKPRNYYPDGGMRENGASCGFLLHYGPFEYLSCGDAGNNGRVEIPVARAIGQPITAMKAHHHLSWHTMTPEMLSILHPKVVVSESFYSHQPDEPTLKNVLNSGADVFLTGVCDSSLENFPETFSRVKDYRGHIVIRVYRGGRRFRVYKLDDTDFSRRVLSVHPYRCTR